MLKIYKILDSGHEQEAQEICNGLKDQGKRAHFSIKIIVYVYEKPRPSAQRQKDIKREIGDWF